MAVPTNISLEFKWMEVENTLAYYDTATITAVKSFIVQASGACTIKLITAVIYGFSQ